MACSLFSSVRKPRFLAFVGWLLSAAAALGNPFLEPENPEFQYDDSRDVPWIEQETQIPDLPDLIDLQYLQIDGLPRGLKLYLDTARLTIDPNDEVIRLWLYVRSDRGADNGTYEGFRCTTGEYKVYAYATPRREQAVTPARGSAWRAAKGTPGSRYRRALMNGYLCGLRGARPPVDIRQAVRAGQPRDPMLYR
jgi:hypothetical protein